MQGRVLQRYEWAHYAVSIYENVLIAKRSHIVPIVVVALSKSMGCGNRAEFFVDNLLDELSNTIGRMEMIMSENS